MYIYKYFNCAWLKKETMQQRYKIKQKDKELN